MKVSAVYLHNLGSSLNQSLDKARFILRRTFWCLFLTCFLMQGASPSVNMSFFCESHSMVITTSHVFNPGRHLYLSKLCQVNDTIWRYAEFTVEMWSTDKHFTAFWYDDWVVATRADASCWLTILELTKDGSWKKCVSLAADSNFSIFVLAKGPYKWLLIYYLLRDNLNIIEIIFIVDSLSSRCTNFFILLLHRLAVWVSCMIRWAAKAPVYILALSNSTITAKHWISSCSILAVLVLWNLIVFWVRHHVHGLHSSYFHLSSVVTLLLIRESVVWIAFSEPCCGLLGGISDAWVDLSIGRPRNWLVS